MFSFHSKGMRLKCSQCDYPQQPAFISLTRGILSFLPLGFCKRFKIWSKFFLTWCQMSYAFLTHFAQKIAHCCHIELWPKLWHSMHTPFLPWLKSHENSNCLVHPRNICRYAVYTIVMPKRNALAMFSYFWAAQAPGTMQANSILPFMPFIPAWRMSTVFTNPTLLRWLEI